MKNKCATKDYNVLSLPKTRKEQFSDIIKHNYRLFLLLGLILLCFALPLLVSVVVKDISYLNIVQSGETDPEIIYSMKFTTTLIFGATEIVSFVIFSLGLAGILKIIKELIYSEPVFLKEDFKEGIKNNFVQIMVLSLVVGIFSLISNVFSLTMNNKVLKYLPLAVNYGLIFPICFISMFLIAVYKNKFLVIIKTSIILYIKHFPMILLTYVLTIVLVSTKWIPLELFFIKYALFIVLVVLYYPLVIFGSFLYQIYIFDDKINKDQFPDYYKKGLFIKGDKHEK